MFLDSAPDHTERSPARLNVPRAKLMADKFRRFGQWCATDIACALYPANARDVWDKLMAEARREPLPAPDAGPGKTVGPDKLRMQAFSSVPVRSRWEAFARALAEASGGNASDLYVTPSDVPVNTSVGHLAYCSNFPFEQGWGAMTRVERRLREVAPRIGWLVARLQYGRCVGLQQQGSFPPQPIDAEGLPPVLLVNGLRDHNTPPAGGREVAEQLPGSVWIGADAGHAVYLHGNRCVRDIAHRYLRTGDLPESGTVCQASRGGDRRTAASSGSPGVG